MKKLIRVSVQYALRQQCCKTHKRPLIFYLYLYLLIHLQWLTQVRRLKSLCQTIIPRVIALYDPKYNYPQSNNDKDTRTSQKSSDKRERTLGTAVLVDECICWVCLSIQLEIYVVYEGTLLAEVGVISY